MEHGMLISEYYKDDDDGGVAKIYQITEDNDTSYYSIAFFNKHKVMIATEDFRNKSLRYVEDAAENWTIGIKQVLASGVIC